MSFREKSAWITVVTLIFVSLFLVTHAPGPWTLRPQSGGFMLQVLHVGVIAFIAIEIVAHAIIVIRAPKEALAPKDEREKLIALKASRLAGLTYVVLSMVSVSMLHLGANAIGLAYMILYSFVLSQIVKYAARIVYYRRGV